ncbi:General transcription factor IIH subunit 3 [Trichinella nativa]|uniref:General transcription factor IIH subunit 3 n=1 Tax=Trichinella nativa TaxID=6335 RepID=A0A0V1KVY8_9BILA|nr:General transcription factor IIH subunit 3 [Trichinella nativa]OUC42601.1 transcription factor tfb4 [Trichinella nativa]
MDEKENILFLIVDLNPVWLGRLMEMAADSRGLVIGSYTSSITAFSKAYSAMSMRNRILAIGVCFRNRLIFHPTKSELQSGNFETDISIISERIRNGMIGLIGENRHIAAANCKSNFSCRTSLSPALAQCICYLNRQKKSKDESKISGRILLVKLSDDTTDEYVNLMNVFFTAQKQNLIIDCISLGQNLALMQQACDITGGLYMMVDNVGALLPHLMVHYLPNADLRNMFQIPKTKVIDYRPICSCHHNLVECAWVCSACLSVFCNFQPICSTCQTVFQIPVLPQVGKRKENA